MADEKKIPKVQAGYLPAKIVAPKGTSCDTCRDFIRLDSECTIVYPAHVNGPHGTCILYLRGEPHEYGRPLRLIAKDTAGYIEGKDVPTFCGRCKYYGYPHHSFSPCAKVGDSPEDTVDFGGCCNLYEARTSTNEAKSK